MAIEALGSVEPRALAEARDQAHQALQVIASTGETLLAHRPDTSHTAAVYEPASGALASHPLPGNGARVALHFDPLALGVSVQGRDARRLELAGHTAAEAAASTRDSLSKLRGAPCPELVHPGYALPSHPLAQGARFAPEPDAVRELGRWFAAGQALLEASLPREASEILCWPHHFDLAALIPVRRDGEGNATATVGVGLSPGDEDIPEPYWYVNHWPAAPEQERPGLPAGAWHTQGWIGGLLRGSEVVAAGDADAQAALMRTFLEAAIAANRKLIEP